MFFLFSFRGLQARFIADASCIWDETGSYAHEAAVRMVEVLQRRLDEMASEGPGSSQFSGFLDLVAETQSMAVVWRRLIRVGTVHAATIGN